MYTPEPLLAEFSEVFKWEKIPWAHTQLMRACWVCTVCVLCVCTDGRGSISHCCSHLNLWESLNWDFMPSPFESERPVNDLDSCVCVCVRVCVRRASTRATVFLPVSYFMKNQTLKGKMCEKLCLFVSARVVIYHYQHIGLVLQLLWWWASH